MFENLWKSSIDLQLSKMVRMIMNLIQTFEGVLKELKGSLRNYDGDDNENVTKHKRLMSKTMIPHV